MSSDRQMPRLSLICEILFYVFAAECTFGSSGRLLSFGSLSIRILLFLLCFVASLPLVFARWKQLLRNLPLISVLLLGVFCVFSTIIGIKNGNEFGYIWADISGLLTLALLPGALVIIDNEKKLNRLLNVIFYSAFFVCAATIALHFAIPSMTSHNVNLLNIWINERALGGLAMLETGIQRIYFRSQIFLQFAIVFGVQKILQAKSWHKVLMILLTGAMVFAVILSLTRGFWVGLFFSAIILLILEHKQWKQLFAAAGSLLLVLALFVGASSLRYGKPYIVQEFINRFDPSLIVVSVPNTPEETKPTEVTVPSETTGYTASINVDAVVRREQRLVEMKKLIQKNFVLGNGLGTSLEGDLGGGKTEYMYLDYLMKLGFVGFVLFLAAFVLPCLIHLIHLFKEYRGKMDKTPLLTANNYLISAYIGVAITSYFNPFLSSPMGILMLFTTVLSVTLINQSQKA